MTDLKAELEKEYTIFIEYSNGDHSEFMVNYTNARNIVTVLKEGDPPPVISFVDLNEEDIFPFTNKIDIIRIQEMREEEMENL